jgi:FKBP-type peptidyl-prolyl cis-trans isomerase SlyD
MRAQIISFHCVLRSRTGDLISSTFNHEVLTVAEGEEPAMLPGLAEGLQNLKTGEKRQIRLTADRAYGFYDPKLVTECPRDELARGAALQMGDEVKGKIHTGRNQVYRVIGVSRHAVTLDGNHPLAGQDLVFDIEATEARDATQEDLAEGLVSACEALPGVH